MIALGLIFSLLIAAPPDPPAWGTLPEALAAAAAMDRPVLAYASAAWCAPCRRLQRETLADPAVQQRLAQLALARLDVDDRDSRQTVGPYRLSPAAWARRLGVEGPPGIVLLAPDGAVLARHTGFLPPDGLLPILDAALAASASLSPDR